MKYFLCGRPFRFVPTGGLFFLVLGEGIMLGSNSIRQCRQAWPQGPLEWGMWLMALGALMLLALVFQAAVREYVGRPDKPARFWHNIRLLNQGSGAENKPEILDN